MQNVLSIEKRSQPQAGGALTIQYHCHSELNRPKGGGDEESRDQCMRYGPSAINTALFLAEFRRVFR
jgi:hypothetical protein